MKKITSPHNQVVKDILDLEKPRERKAKQQFLVEGLREISLAIKGGFQIRKLVFCPQIISIDEVNLICKDIFNPDFELIETDEIVFKKIAYREDSGGLIAIADMKKTEFSSLQIKPDPLVVVLESVEKPGNLGAILRTCDAAGVDLFVVCDQQTDIYNPNVVRSSLGCLFTVPVIQTSSEEALVWFKEKNIKVFSSTPAAKKLYNEVDYCSAVAIALGSEAFGLTDLWLKNLDFNIKIPMNGKVDSINVSNAGAILIFEALRQRGFHKTEQ